MDRRNISKAFFYIKSLQTIRYSGNVFNNVVDEAYYKENRPLKVKEGEIFMGFVFSKDSYVDNAYNKKNFFQKESHVFRFDTNIYVHGLLLYFIVVVANIPLYEVYFYRSLRANCMGYYYFSLLIKNKGFFSKNKKTKIIFSLL